MEKLLECIRSTIFFNKNLESSSDQAIHLCFVGLQTTHKHSKYFLLTTNKISKVIYYYFPSRCALAQRQNYAVTTGI